MREVVGPVRLQGSLYLIECQMHRQIGGVANLVSLKLWLKGLQSVNDTKVWNTARNGIAHIHLQLSHNDSSVCQPCGVRKAHSTTIPNQGSTKQALALLFLARTDIYSPNEEPSGS